MADYKKEDLDALIMEVTGLTTITPMINKQVQRFCIEEKMTWKEIARCIVWYTEVAHKEVNPIYGIAFVPNVRELAEKYFHQLELDQQRQNKAAQKVVEYQDNNIIFNISKIPHKKRKPKFLNIAEINVEDDHTDEGEVK